MSRNRNNPRGGSPKPPVPYPDRVRRLYPSAACHRYPCGTYEVQGPGGRVLGRGDSPTAAWMEAARAVKPPQRATI